MEHTHSRMAVEMGGRFFVAALLALLALALVPAIGSAQTTLPTSSTGGVPPATTSTSGLATISRVDLGSTCATVTMDVDGSLQSVNVDYADVTDEDGPIGEYAPWLVLGAAGSAGLRVLSLLIRLGG